MLFTGLLLKKLSQFWLKCIDTPDVASGLWFDQHLSSSHLLHGGISLESS